MENESLTEVVPNVLSQWLFFFLILAFFLLPGFIFMKLAMKYKEKGWIYFILGLVIMIIGLNIGQYIESVIISNIYLDNGSHFHSLMRFAIAILFCLICYKFLQKKLAKNNG